jgi:hypothetical protein
MTDFIAQANLIHENGPAVTPPSTLYFHFLKPATEDFPAGETIIAPATNAEMYLRIGYTITGEETIENFVEWNEQNATRAAPKAKAETSPPAAKSNPAPQPPTKQRT